MEQDTKSFLAQLQERTRQGANSAQELKAQAKDSTTTPSLEHARSFVEGRVLAAVEQAADGGNWHVELSLLRPGLELNEVVLVNEVKRLLHERGVRADILVWPKHEHIVVHVSWLPAVGLVPQLSSVKAGRVAIFASDLRGTGTVTEAPVPSFDQSGKSKVKVKKVTTLKELFVSRYANVFQCPINDANKNYMVEFFRDASGLKIQVHGRIEVRIVGTVNSDGTTDLKERPDQHEYLPVRWKTEEDGAIVPSDLRDMTQAIYEALSGKGEGGKAK
jgi:hypothetical protein